MVFPTSTKTGFLYRTEWHEQNFWLIFCVCKFFLSLAVLLTVLTIRWELRVRGENKKDTGHRKFCFLSFALTNLKERFLDTNICDVEPVKTNKPDGCDAISPIMVDKCEKCCLKGLNSSSLMSPTPGLNWFVLLTLLISPKSGFKENTNCNQQKVSETIHDIPQEVCSGLPSSSTMIWFMGGFNLSQLTLDRRWVHPELHIMTNSE